MSHLAAILHQNFKMMLCAPMGHYKPINYVHAYITLSHNKVPRSDHGKVHPDKVQNGRYGSHIGSDQNFT